MLRTKIKNVKNITKDNITPTCEPLFSIIYYPNETLYFLLILYISLFYKKIKLAIVDTKNDDNIREKECFIPGLILPSDNFPITNPLKSP